jgi:hypothetical protein
VSQKTINWKLLAVSLVGAVLAVVGLRFLHSWQIGRLAKGLLDIAAVRESEAREAEATSKVDAAQAREANKKWMEAASYCERYLRVHPGDVEVRGRLATDFAKGANRSSREEMSRAVELHYRVLAAEPAREKEIELRSELCHLLLRTGRFFEAEREARHVLELDSKNASGSRVLSLALVAQWENGTLATAKLEDLRLLSNVENARRLNPSDVLLAEIAAKLYRDQPRVVAAEFAKLSLEERTARADECLNSLVSQNPKDAKAYLARFRYRTRHGMSGADEDIARALEMAPQDEEVVLTAAQVAFQKGLQGKSRGAAMDARADLERARALYETLAGEKSERLSPDASLGLGEALLAEGDFEGAIQAWRTGLNRFSAPTAQIAFLARIADASLNSDRADDADDSLDTIDKLISTLGNSVPREQRLGLIQSQALRRASWHMKRNEPALAIPVLQ